MTLATRRPWLVCAGVVVSLQLAGCQSAASGAAKTSISWAATAQWAAQAWLSHEAPTQFARRAVASAHDALVEERDAVRKEARSPAAAALGDSVDVLARHVAVLRDRLEDNDRAGVVAAVKNLARFVALWSRTASAGS